MENWSSIRFSDRSCLAKIFFCWLYPLFRHGYKNSLEMTDLHRICHQDSASSLADKLEIEWQREVAGSASGQREPSLRRALVRTFGLRAAVVGGLVFLEECVFKLLQPVLLTLLLAYFSPTPAISRPQAYLCAAGIVVCAAFCAVLHHPYFFNMQRLGMRIRVALSALIFRKSLRLSNAALGQTTVGKLVNILSSDVSRFDLMMLFVHFVWIGPMQLVILLVILFRAMGPSCLVGFVILICLSPLQAWMGKLFSRFRSKTALLTDERVRIMNEVISGMRIIKIHAWEKPFTELVELSRRREIGKVLHSSYLRAFNLSFFSMATTFISFATLTVYTYTGHVLTPGVVFLAMPLFNVVRLTVVLFIPYCIMFGSEGLIAISRIQGFLLMEELPSLKRLPSLSSLASDGNLPVAEQIGEPLGDHPDPPVADGDGAEGPANGGVAVTFLPAGNDHSDGREQGMKYMSLKESVKEEEEEEEEEEREEDNRSEGKQIEANEGGQAETDVEKIAVAVETLVAPGEKLDKEIILRNLNGSWDISEEGKGFMLRDINLSVKAGELLAVIGPVGCGKSSLLMAAMNELPGQTGDVIVEGSLAYTAQQPWVFSGTLRDNILFGRRFDAVRYREVLSVCALTTDIIMFPDGDLTLVGDRGITLSGGQRARVSLARAVYHDADVYLLDDPLSAVDSAVGRHLFDKCITGHLRKKPVVLVTHQLQYLSAADCIVVLKEGSVVARGTYSELQSSGIDFTALLKEHEAEERTKADPPPPMSLASSVLSLASEVSACKEELQFKNDVLGSQPLMEGKESGSIGYRVYTTFLLAGAGALGLVVFAICNCTAQAFMVLTDWWLAQWAYAEQTACSELLNGTCAINTAKPNHTLVESLGVDRSRYLHLYVAFLCCFIVLGFLRTYQLFFILVNASRRLHDRMFAAIIRAPMRFFDTNPIGRILNRFSKDLSFMDEMLPVTFADFNSICMQTLGIVITICIFNPVVLVFTVPLCVVFVLARRYFLATSRDIKRLEGTTRSPVFSHLSATLQGLVTIRAFGVQGDFTRRFDARQDAHTCTWFHFLTTTRLFGMVLDWMVVAFLAVVAFCCILADDLFDLNSSVIGLTLTYCITLMGSFQWGVRQSAEVENLMTSTERVVEYTRLEPEAPLESSGEHRPPAHWPTHGIITFEDVSVSYSADGPLVLKNLRCCIRAQEKVGVVGRTGAGKSSLMAALMRLTEPRGTLKIDGIQITDIGLHDLRKRISFIPQDPVLFSGTLRKNLDPFTEHDDEEIWNALEEVQLKAMVNECAEKLELGMTEGGLNFSVGQRQLVCLARALLHRNKILIVDEATANVDPRTDRLIQETIRKKFQQCTVLTIAHRLNTIMDSDRILVLDEGRIVEFDEPFVLLQTQERSLLSRMVEETGGSEATKLFAVAKEKYFHANPSNPYGYDPDQVYR